MSRDPLPDDVRTMTLGEYHRLTAQGELPGTTGQLIVLTPGLARAFDDLEDAVRVLTVAYRPDDIAEALQSATDALAALDKLKRPGYLLGGALRSGETPVREPNRAG